MTKAVFRKNGYGLWAMCDESRKVMASIKDQKEVMVSVHAPRNPKHHRMFFALLNKVVESGAWGDGNEEEYGIDGSVDSLLLWVKFRLAHVDMVVVNGVRKYAPRSINFESMSQDKFRPFFDRAVYYLCSDIIGTDDWEKVRDEIVEMIDQGYSDLRNRK